MTKQFWWTLLLFSCHSNSGTDVRPITITVDSAKTLALDIRDSGLKKSVKHFDNHQPFKILSFTSTVIRNTTDTDTSKCSSWTLTEENISEIIKNSEPIDGTTWDLSFSVLTCEKSVRVLQRGQEYEIGINAAAFFSVSNGDTTMLFGDYKKADRKYFIQAPNDQ